MIDNFHDFFRNIQDNSDQFSHKTNHIDDTCQYYENLLDELSEMVACSILIDKQAGDDEYFEEVQSRKHPNFAHLSVNLDPDSRHKHEEVPQLAQQQDRHHDFVVESSQDRVQESHVEVLDAQLNDQHRLASYPVFVVIH